MRVRQDPSADAVLVRPACLLLETAQFVQRELHHGPVRYLRVDLLQCVLLTIDRAVLYSSQIVLGQKLTHLANRPVCVGQQQLLMPIGYARYPRTCASMQRLYLHRLVIRRSAITAQPSLAVLLADVTAGQLFAMQESGH